MKHNDPVVMVRAYELLAERGDWPLHLGVTEAGPAFQGTIKSPTAFGALLSKGIGDTIRVSLSRPAGRGGQGRQPDPPVAQPAAAQARDRLLPLVRSRPGRRLHAGRRGHRGPRGPEVPLRVAVMGCVVNGPGEAREADLGVACGNGKGQIFVRGEVIKTVPEKHIVETLIEEAMRIAESMERDGEDRRRTARSPSADPRRQRSPHVVVVGLPLQLGRTPVDRPLFGVRLGLQPSGDGPRGKASVQGEQPPQHGHQDDVETVQDADDEQNPPDPHDLPLQLARRDVADEGPPAPRAARNAP